MGVNRRRTIWATLAFIAAIDLSCATSRPLHPDGPAGYWHTLAAGESLEALARSEGVPLEDVLEINGLARAQDIQPGAMVFILRPEKTEPITPLADKPTATTAPGERAGSISPSERGGPVHVPKVVGPPPFAWPVASPQLASPFGFRDGRTHEGIDLSAATGTPVFAARDGVVLYAGDAVKGYGNMVVVEHDNGLLTVYAHNSELLARAGDKVKGGQTIAKVGQTGRATAPHLHFEVRRGEVPQDPLRFLPQLRRR